MSESFENCEISLPVGQIRGVKRRTLYDDEYFSFERLPFGQPPVGELRFKAPKPAEPWTGVLDCTHFGEKPVQRSLSTRVIDGAEDCLYLNVYAKQLKTEKPLPVMVYIYGGAFSIGEATRELYAPDYLMAKDVVLVTLNYRVDCLGFLSLKDPSLEVPGNAGLKDQVLAIKWVKQYISHFNGDANNITVFGESAGGCSTHYMMCTEQTRDLFHKAIPMSGTLHNYWSNTLPADFAFRLAKANGYEGENVDRQVLEHLRNVEPYKLVDHDLLTTEDRRNGLIYAFGPTVEPYVMDDCVAPRSQLEMARNAWSNKIPVMLGGTSFEGLFMFPAVKANIKGLDKLLQDPLRMTPYDVRVLNTEKQNLEYSHKMIKLYFGDEIPSSAHMMNMLDYYSYKIFWHGFQRTLQARLAYANKAPTYFYRFDFDSPDFNFFRQKFCGDEIKQGVAHADDLSYLFRNSQSWKLDKSSGEYRTIQRMVDIWTSFAATSNPNCDETAHLNWKPAQQEQPQRVLNISNEIEIIDLPEHEKLQTWDSLYKKEHLY
ncbi:GH19267 [Drosophila grimshawi]|uniref:carboxylesterase n=3 Tax=Drosophila grimshawi TaxID=7222 RepID=B4JF82_DROGR|nr:GH19267 [Drosophila grimshawi]